jgi:pectin methylesterase-like acyl-CoA thioesterase
VLVKDGLYKEKVRVDAPCVMLSGQSRAGTRIEFPQLMNDFTQHPGLKATRHNSNHST